MAGGEERSDDWGNHVAKWTTLWTVILAALFVGAVFIFIL
jgi:hypothetical protein